MKNSLVISTYNWPEALELVLKSVKNQSKIPDEILIADDGSSYSTKKVIEKYKKMLNIKHIWHEDKGFRKTIILNKAIAKSSGEYIIQIDGDILLHKHFIKDHLRNKKINRFIHGSRTFIGKHLTQKCILKSNIKFSFFHKEIKNRINMLYSPFFSKIISSDSKSLKGTRGCNFSFYKKDFIKVNGYNESLTGWGKEDTELSARLINNNLKKRKLKFNAITFHLNHKSSSRENLDENNGILQKVIEEKIIKCKNGIEKYL